MRRVLGVLVAAVVLLGCASGDPAAAPPTTEPGAASTRPTGSTQPTEPTGTGTGTEAEVLGVTDGDTFDVRLVGAAETVRLIGINAPEQGECFSTEATAALTDLLEDGTVHLVADESDRDQFGRLLRYVFVDDLLVNEVLVRDGFAQAYRYEPDVARADQLDAAQAEARAAERGLWAPDACGRADADAGAVVVARIEADPPGDDTLDANAEYAVVANRSDAPVDLTGWVLKDETASHRFAFPAGFTLAPGASVAVHTGCGSPTLTDLFWCNQGSAVWNNDGDTAFLLDSNGNVVDTRSY